MNLRWITWLLLFALLVIVVSSKSSKSSNSSKSKSASKSHSHRSKSHSDSHHSNSKKSHSKKSHSKKSHSKKSHSKKSSSKKSRSKKSSSSDDDNVLDNVQIWSRSRSHHSRGTRNSATKGSHSHSHSHGSKGSHSHSHSHSSRSRSRSHRHGSWRSRSHSRSRSGSRSRDWRHGRRDDIWRDWTKDRHGKREKARLGKWRSPEERRKSNDYGCQCQASGDPHFTTCDSKTFDYQGACSYTLVTNDCPGANIDLNDIIFRVVITTVQWKNSDRTRTKEVTIILIKGEEKITLTLDSTPGRMKEQGVWADLPSLKENFYESSCSSREMVLDVFESMRLTWDFSMKISVKLHDKYKGKVCGLCGNYDGDDGNDYLLNGGQEPLAADSTEEELVPFGDSWYFDVGGSDPKCKEPIVAVNPCDKAEVRQKVEAVCNIIKSEVVFPGMPRAKRDTFHRNCMVDFCMDHNDKSEACLHVRDFATACRDAGFTVDENAINAVCSYNCPAGKEFLVDYIGDRLCSAPGEDPVGPSSSGCFCKGDMFLDGTDCVAIDACGCSLDGVYMKINAEKISDNCALHRKCKEDGTMVVEPYGCHPDATCKTENGKQTCQCNPGYVGDGHKNCEKTEVNTIGVRSGGELDRTAFKASTVNPPFNSYDGRLNDGSCWKPMESDPEPWLQVALLEEYTVLGVRLQACPDASCSISDLKVSYRLEEECAGEECENFITAQEFTSVTLEGEFTTVMLVNPIPRARFIRVYVKNSAGCIGMRMDIIGKRSNCPQGYTAGLNSCYKHVSTPKNYRDARIHCARENGYLVEIFDSIENDYVNSLKNEKNGNDILLGMSSFREDGKIDWYNEHGSSNKFDAFEDRYKTTKECARMLFSGKWADNDCNWSLQFVCESGGGNSCPEPWTRIHDGCYYLVEGKRNFTGAIAACDALGGHVPFITSPWENIAVSRMAGGKQAWIGLTDVKQEGTFEHYLLHRPLSFTAWAEHEPNDWSDGEDCATTNWQSTGQWNDVSCDVEYTTVCERGLNKHHIDLGVCDVGSCNGGGSCVGFYNWYEEKADYRCECFKSRSGDRCDEAMCDCFAWGDPHFGTCDGFEFLFQGLCSYTMAMDGCVKPFEKTFQIIIKTDPFPKYPGTSKTLYVVLLTDFILGKPLTRISLHGGHVCYVNGEERAPGFTLKNGIDVKRTNGKTVVEVLPGISIKWDGNMRVHMYIDHTHRGKICGMCGNFNGIKEDDVRDANGDGKINSHDWNVFGESYQYDPDCDAVPEEPLPIDELCNQASPDTKVLVEELIAELSAEHFAKCVLELGTEEVERVIENIKIETCSTGLRENGCRALESFQIRCSKATGFVCLSESLQCGETPGENEMYYCGEGVEMFCGDTEESIIDRWIPDYLGLKCMDGYVRDANKCILQENCGCHVECANGEKFTLQPDEMRRDSTCSVEYSCRYDNILRRYITGEEPHACSVDADCIGGKCVCRSCYEGDGYQCNYVTDPTVDDLPGYILGVTCNSRLSDSSIILIPSQDQEDDRPGRPGRLCKEDIFFMPPPEFESPYIEITLNRETPIRAIITRGYYDLDCWPSAVEIHYSIDDGASYQCLKEDGEGASCLQYETSYQLRKTAIKEFTAKHIRIVPIQSDFRSICLQVELFGGKVYNCPKGFTSLRSGCYALIDEEKTFERAVSACGRMNGYVVEISSKREYLTVREFAGERDIWLGLANVQGDMKFENIRGSPTFFSNFDAFEPNVMEPLWAHIFMRGSNGKWARVDGNERRYVVCEALGDAMTIIPEGRKLGAGFRGEIPDSQFSSSSFRDQLFPERGRLNSFGDNSAWGPELTDTDPYLEIKLNSPNQVTGIVLQGRGDSKEYTNKFTVSYSLNCNEFNQVMDGDVAQVFLGPADRSSPITVIFEPYFNALCIRVHPLPKQLVPIALRVEFYGILIEPLNPCMGGLLANIELAPDNGFKSSHCAIPENEGEAISEVEACARLARWNENNVFWSPGVRGNYEYLQIEFAENIIARAFKVKVKEGSEMPAFHVHYSPDGIVWLCAMYNAEQPSPLFPASGEIEHIYQLAAEVDLRFIRFLPQCDNIPYLMIDILGCTKMEALEIDLQKPVLVVDPVPLVEEALEEANVIV